MAFFVEGFSFAAFGNANDHALLISENAASAQLWDVHAQHPVQLLSFVAHPSFDVDQTRIDFGFEDRILIASSYSTQERCWKARFQDSDATLGVF